MDTTRLLLVYFGAFVGLVVGNFFYQWRRRHDWEAAVRSSFDQAVAFVALFITSWLVRWLWAN